MEKKQKDTKEVFQAAKRRELIQKETIMKHKAMKFVQSHFWHVPSYQRRRYYL